METNLHIQSLKFSEKNLASARKALRQSEERFRQMVEGVRDYAIFMLDPYGQVTTWNEGAKRIKGYETSEIVGRHFSNFYPKEDVEKTKKLLAIAVAEGRVEDEGWRVRKDGTKFWADVVITRVNDDDGNLIGFSKVTRDLSDKKRMEDELRAAKDDLERRVIARTKELEEAIRSRDEFISIASHELKTPLSALKLQAQITNRGLNNNNEQMLTKEYLSQFTSQINRQIDRLRQLVDDMLDVTRMQRGTLALKMETTNLTQLVNDVVARFQPEMDGAGCSISVDVESDIVGIWDRYRIEQVVLNLLSNAAKYSPGHPVKVRLWKKEQHAFISVKDSGPGISKSDQKRIFNRFERAVDSSEVTGLGLGLYITKEILNGHQGDIEVESELGQGAEFLVRLPLESKAEKVLEEGREFAF